MTLTTKQKAAAWDAYQARAAEASPIIDTLLELESRARQLADTWSRWWVYGGDKPSRYLTAPPGVNDTLATVWNELLAACEAAEPWVDAVAAGVWVCGKGCADAAKDLATLRAVIARAKATSAPAPAPARVIHLTDGDIWEGQVLCGAQRQPGDVPRVHWTRNRTNVCPACLAIADQSEGEPHA